MPEPWPVPAAVPPLGPAEVQRSRFLPLTPPGARALPAELQMLAGAGTAGGDLAEAAIPGCGSASGRVGIKERERQHLLVPSAATPPRWRGARPPAPGCETFRGLRSAGMRAGCPFHMGTVTVPAARASGAGQEHPVGREGVAGGRRGASLPRRLFRDGSPALLTLDGFSRRSRSQQGRDSQGHGESEAGAVPKAARVRPPRALPAEARVAPLPAPLGTCYSWQRQLENGRQRRNFVCSGLGPGQTSGLQLSGARDRPPVPPGAAPRSLPEDAAGGAGPDRAEPGHSRGATSQTPAMSRTLLLLLLLLRGLAAGRPPAAATPRLKLSFPELRARHGLHHFSLEHSCCYEALLLDEERGRLFVGAKNHLLSLALDDISQRGRKIYWPAPVEWREECNWAGKDITAECMNFVKILHPYNRTHLYACGTGAFHPVCAFIEAGQHAEEPVFKLDPHHIEDGKGKSPYDPRHTAASVLVGEELYSGVATDLMGRDFTIFRSLGRRPSIRTEQHDSRWLNEPKFVAVFLVPESEDPDDDKIYFFFRETAVERQQGLGKTSFARIGQICRNDMGGQRSLVNKWTTFLKARLVCAVPGPDGADTHFDELRDVFLLQTRDKRNPLIYAIFSTSSSVFQGSAVCVYTMADIRRAFLGPFAHKEGPNYQWVSYQGRVPYPRPGMCPSKTFGTFGSTKDFPDEVIQFARHHPLMYNPVLPHGQRPLFLQATVPYTFTRIAVDRVTAADGHYDVLFIGTDVGTVLKVVSVPKESWHRMEPLLLEELQVFQDSSPIISLQLSSKRHQLYAGSTTALAQLPLHRCSAYGKACAECCLARDPYCAWDGNTCTRYVPNTKRRFRRQDVRNGDPNVLCSEDPRRDTVPQKQLYGVEGSTVFLECIPKSLQAHILWTYQRTLNDPQREVQMDERVVRTERGVLLRSVQRSDAGLYLCHATEHGFTQPLLRLSLEVIGAWQATGVASAGDPQLAAGIPGRKVWYRDFLQLVERPPLGATDKVCQRLWSRGRPPAPARSPAGPPGRGQGEEPRRARRRRTHEGPRAERGPRSASPW
ncbi:semaphorin-3B [Molothrus ater]|uniref:semaphorin-3B n=2 Tax=Icteridae TaxID=164646 RepID=UPI00174D604B|nr:semaphorin-3B [Molothrus ater]